jgi:hypothetical protein
MCCKSWSFSFLSFYVLSVVLMDWLTLIPSMLAVMTMNVGYFLSVLAGIWVGTLLLGAVTPATDGLQHC